MENAGTEDMERDLNKSPSAHRDHDINKETIGDILIDQLEAVAKTTERRSSMSQLTAKVLMTIQNSFHRLAKNWLNKKIVILKTHNIYANVSS